jgi:pyruvate-formate lyase
MELAVEMAEVGQAAAGGDGRDGGVVDGEQGTCAIEAMAVEQSGGGAAEVAGTGAGEMAARAACRLRNPGHTGLEQLSGGEALHHGGQPRRAAVRHVRRSRGCEQHREVEQEAFQGKQRARAVREVAHRSLEPLEAVDGQMPGGHRVGPEIDLIAVREMVEAVLWESEVDQGESVALGGKAMPVTRPHHHQVSGAQHLSAIRQEMAAATGSGGDPEDLGEVMVMQRETGPASVGRAAEVEGLPGNQVGPADPVHDVTIPYYFWHRSRRMRHQGSIFASEDAAMPTMFEAPPIAHAEALTRLELAEHITAVHAAHAYDAPARREAAVLAAMFPAALRPLQPGDRLAGRLAPRDYPLVGFSPEPGGYGYYCSIDALASADLGDDAARRSAAIAAYWHARTTRERARASFPPAAQALFASDDWTSQPQLGAALFRMAGIHLDYPKLMQHGLPGLAALVEKRRSRLGDDLADGLRASLRLVADCCRHYAGQAQGIAEACAGDERQRLLAIAAACAAVAERAPRSFREAMQLGWIYSLVAGALNYGRMDVWLGGFLAADLDAGRLDDVEAQDLVTGLWRLIASRKTIWNGRVIIGGLARPDPVSADRFCRLAIEASRAVAEIEPQLSLRFHPGSDPAILRQAYDCIGAGRTYPMLYNDAVNVPAVMRAFNVDEASAQHYLPYGCGEYVLDHRSFGTPNGVINLLKCLEAALHDGCCALSGARIGPATGDPAGFASFDDLWRAYDTQVRTALAALADVQACTHRAAAAAGPFLLLTLLYDDCLERGLPVFSGGIRWFGGTMEAYGNTNTGDSLTAIETLVWKQGRLTLPQVIAILDADFDGHPHEHAAMRACPKFGNDDATADAMLVRVHEHVCRITAAQAARTGLASYLVVVINNNANTTLGRLSAASADGRRCAGFMANANNPMGGCDVNGVTAFLNSLLRPDPGLHAGAVQNMRFSRDLFTTRRSELEALLGAWFDQGGSQAMISVLSREDLEEAVREPRMHANLMVRVGGFSARFVELDPGTQREILSRTLH